MHMLWKLLFPLALPFLTFAEENGGTNGGTNGEDDPDKGSGGEEETEEDEENGTDDPDKGKGEEEGEEDLDSLKAERKRLRVALRSANKEAKERRLLLKKLQEEDTKRKKADMGELELAQTELKEATTERDGLREKNTALTLRHAIELGAAGMGIDPEDALALIDRAQIKIDEDTGKVEGVDKALKALLKAKPYLVSSEENDDFGTPRSKRKSKSKLKSDQLPKRSLVNM